MRYFALNFFRDGEVYDMHCFGELCDAESKGPPRGYTVLQAEFLWNSELRVFFRNAVVRPMLPDHIDKYIPKPKQAIPGVLSGRDTGPPCTRHSERHSAISTNMDFRPEVGLRLPPTHIPADPLLKVGLVKSNAKQLSSRASAMDERKS